MAVQRPSPKEVPPSVLKIYTNYHQKHVLYILFHCEISRTDITVLISHKEDLRFKVP